MKTHKGNRGRGGAQKRVVMTKMHGAHSAEKQRLENLALIERMKARINSKGE